VAGIDATYFTELSSNSRGFATLSVGYAWLDWPFDDEWVWGGRVGAEFDVNAQFTAIASVGYDATFDHGSDGVFDGSLRLNYRASDKLLPYIEVSAIEGGDWGAALGVAYKF